MKKQVLSIFMLTLLLAGCSAPEIQWKIFSDDQFSMTYPEGVEQQTEGDEVFKAFSQGCMISVSKFEDQPNYDNFVSYLKGIWTDVDGLTVENEYTISKTTDFTVRATEDENAYKGSIRIKGCEEDTIYLTLVGCDREFYDQNSAMIDRIIDSVECD